MKKQTGKLKIDPKHPFFSVLDAPRPIWAAAQGLTLKEEVQSHRRFREALAKECGTDDIAVLAAKVKRIKTVTCGRCHKGCECIEVGPNHHVTENHVCEPTGPQTFTLRLG